MLLISRYLLREFLIASGSVLLGLMVLWMAADTLLRLDELGEGGGIARMLRDSLLVLPLGVPIACVVGIVWSVTSAVKAREITAIRCSGFPVQRALLPVLVVSFGIAVLLGWFTDRMIIKSRQAAVPESDAPVPQKLGAQYWYATGKHVFSAEKFEAGVLEKVTYFKLGPNHQIQQRIDAAAARFLDGSRWQLSGVVTYDFTGGGMRSESAQKLELDLGISSRDLEEALRNPSQDTLNQLAEKISVSNQNSERLPLELEFHSRLAEPLSVLILVLLALPFAIGDVERGDSFARALLASLTAAAAFWMIWSVALAAGSSGVVPPALPVWGVVVLSLGLGSWRYRLIPQ